MIEKIKLTPFQCHDGLELTFDPKITTIVGPSDTGKTSIIRALRWALRGGPAPAAAPAGGPGDVCVEVTIDGRLVRRRAGADNLYQLDDEEFRAFRRALPGPVEEFLRLDDINFQGQHDSVYWLAAPAPEISRQLNQLVDLEIIDETLGRAAATVRRLNAQRDEANGAAKAAWEAYRAAPDVREAGQDLQRVKSTDARRTKIQERIFLLEGCVTDAKAAAINHRVHAARAEAAGRLEDAARRAGKAAARAAGLAACVAAARAAVGALAARPALAAFIRVGTALQLTVTAQQEVSELEAPLTIARAAAAKVARYKGMTFARISATADAACALNADAERLEDVIEEARRAEDDMLHGKRRLVMAEQQLKETNLCPTCGKPL